MVLGPVWGFFIKCPLRSLRGSLITAAVLTSAAPGVDVRGGVFKFSVALRPQGP